MEHCSTDDMDADFMTMSIQGEKIYKCEKTIMDIGCSEEMWTPHRGDAAKSNVRKETNTLKNRNKSKDWTTWVNWSKLNTEHVW